jgi:hypothetical protein
MKETKIIKKINDLIAKADSTHNQYEKIAFYQKAQELIVKNNLNETQLAIVGRGMEERIEEIRTTYFLRQEEWIDNLASVVSINHACLFFYQTGYFSEKVNKKYEHYSEYFDYYHQLDEWEQETYRRPKAPNQEISVVFFGKGSEATIATLIFNSILLLLSKEKNSYKMGFVDGLKKAYEKNWKSYSLVPTISNKVKSAYDEIKFSSLSKVLKKTSVIDAEEYQKGFSAGGRYKTQKVGDGNQQKMLA